VERTGLATRSGVVVHVHEAHPADVDDLYAAFSAVVAAGEGYPQAPDRPLGFDDFRDYWLDHKSLVVVARAAVDEDHPEGEFLGSYYLKPNFAGRAAHIANAGYFVVARQRNQGIGEALVHHSMAEARALGFDALVFNLVFEHNPARRLYERLGFTAVGRIPDAIGGEAALVYWRRL
jgi:ribosomal protein S18 acetylase RimI-like enzyme